jgi:preprotein translocase subunit SecA
MNRQREVVYDQRKKVLRGEDLWSDIDDMLEEITDDMLADYVDEKLHPEEWNLKGLDDRIFKQFSLKLNLCELNRDDIDIEVIREKIISGAGGLLRDKEKDFGKPTMDYLMKVIMLQPIDTQWKDHLLAMDHLKEGIGLRGYGQKDPKREYQREGYEMFIDMVHRIKEDTIEKLSMVQIRREEEIERMHRHHAQSFIMSHGDTDTAPKTVKREGKKIGRNDPCPCGSGKKYKRCCGR